MPTAGSDYDITINSVGYNLDRDDETHAPRWREGRADSTIPVPGAGEIGLGSSPEDEYIVAHVPDLSGGFGQAYYDPQEPNRYAVATGAYLANPFQAGPANRIRHVGFGITDPTAEETGLGASNPWAVTSTATMTATSGNAHTGRYHWAVAGGISGGEARQTIANPTVLRSASMTLRAMGSNATGTIRLFIWDDVTGYTYSSGIAAGAYAQVNVTATINAAATAVRIGVDVPAGGSARVDDIELQFGTPNPVGFVERTSAWYTASGNAIYQWDETGDKFDFVHLLNGYAATDIAQFGGNVYVAGGAGNLYTYGSGTTWTDSNRGGTDDEADFFVSSTDRVGNPVLWRGLKPNTVSVSPNPANSGTAWTNYSVGESNTNITGVYAYEGTIVVGKEDGLYIFINNHFVNLTTEFAVSRSSTNFAQGQEFGGSLYTAANQGTVWRLTQSVFEGPLPGYRLEGYTYGPSGPVGAMGLDAGHLYIGLDKGPTGSTPWLLQTSDGARIHTLLDLCDAAQTGYLTGDTGVVWGDDPTDTYADEFTTIEAIGTFSGYTYLAGTGTDGYTRNTLLRFVSPTRSEVPFRDTSFDSNIGYYVRLPKMNGGFPSEVKSWKDVQFYLRPQVSGTLNVYYRIDGGAWASLGSAAGSDTDPYTSLSFTNVNGRELELLIHGDMGGTPNNTRPLEFLPITVTATLRPSRKRLFAAWVNIGSNTVGTSGIPETNSDTIALYDNLRTAETSNNPVTLTYQEELGVGADTRSISVHVTRLTLDRLLPNPTTGNWSRVYRVDMTEA